MKKLLIFFMLLLNFFAYSVENEWQDNWLNGLELISENPLEARDMFENAIFLMTEEEFQSNLNVPLELAHVNLVLENFDNALEIVEMILKEENLSEFQKLICGNLIVSAFWYKGDEANAIIAYEKYIVKSPLAPRCYFRNDKILMNNVPSYSTCKKTVKNILIKQFCEKEEDFFDYGDVWVIKTTKKNINCCRKNHLQFFCKNKELSLFENFQSNVKRNPEVIRACCNTCSTLAVSAGVACQFAPNVFCRAAGYHFCRGT